MGYKLIYDFNAGTSIANIGSKTECVRFEDAERKKLSQEEQLFKNYRTVRMSDYEKDLEYSEALDKYSATLSEQQLDETVEINGKTYAKYVLDFQKKYYTK